LDPHSPDEHGIVLKAVIDATVITLREMARLEVTPLMPADKKYVKMFGDVSAVIGLLSPADGSLVFSLDEATARTIARRILAGVEESPGDDIVHDCIGEIANVIAGQAKGTLSATPQRFAISTPTIVCGHGHEIRHRNSMSCLLVRFSSEVGDFALQLCLEVPRSLKEEPQ